MRIAGRLILLVFFSTLVFPNQLNAQMRASSLIEHCYGPGKPDSFCLGYMEASLDFITEYQLWLTLNKYDYPPSDGPVCVETGKSPYAVAAAFVAWVQRHPNDLIAANAAVGGAIREAFACKR